MDLEMFPNMFFEHKIFVDPKFWGPNFVLDLNFFGLKIFGPKFFRTQKSKQGQGRVKATQAQPRPQLQFDGF